MHQVGLTSSASGKDQRYIENRCLKPTPHSGELRFFTFQKSRQQRPLRVRYPTNAKASSNRRWGFWTLIFWEGGVTLLRVATQKHVGDRVHTNNWSKFSFWRSEVSVWKRREDVTEGQRGCKPRNVLQSAGHRGREGGCKAPPGRGQPPSASPEPCTPALAPSHSSPFKSIRPAHGTIIEYPLTHGIDKKPLTWAPIGRFGWGGSTPYPPDPPAPGGGVD